MGRAPVALVILVALVGACGKEREELGRQALAGWDPPTAAHGFHPVAVTDCTPYVPASVPTPAAAPEVATGETAETIAILSRRPRSLAANGTHVFWSEVDDSGNGGIFRATRPIGRDRWVVEPLAEEQPGPGELAADRDDVFWLASVRPFERATEIRYRDLASFTAGTIAVEEDRPRRLVASQGSVFWVGGSEHDRIREARRSAEGAWGVRNLTTLDFVPDALAADADAVYAVTTDEMLVRTGRDRDRGRAVVLAARIGSHVVDLAVEGRWVYWLDAGPEIPRCRLPGAAASACAGCYHAGPDLAHPDGSLRRVPRTGGPLEIVARNLPEVGKLTFVRGVAWITTLLDGPRPLRVDPIGGRPTFQPGRTTEARYAALGDGLVTLVAAVGRDPEVRMLAMP